jgi:hypothetical protein
VEYLSFWLYPVFWLVVWMLATWRISSIITREEIGKPLRSLVGITSMRTATGEEYNEIPDTFFGYLFSCLWCMSVWVSILLIVPVLKFPPVLLPFAASAGAILIDRLIVGEH